MIVALRALRNGAADDTREVVDRTLGQAARRRRPGAVDPPIDPGAEPEPTDLGARLPRRRSSGPSATGARCG